MNSYRPFLAHASMAAFAFAAAGCAPAADPPAAAENRAEAAPAPRPAHSPAAQRQEDEPEPIPARRAQQRPAQAAIAADGQSIELRSAVRDFSLPLDEMFAEPVQRIERVTVLGQEDRGRRFDLLLRVEAASDPKADDGRCRTGREVVVQTMVFDGRGSTIGGTSVVASCLNRIRLVGERRHRDGRIEYTLRQRDEDGRDRDTPLTFDAAHPGRDIEL